MLHLQNCPDTDKEWSSGPALKALSEGRIHPSVKVVSIGLSDFESLASFLYILGSLHGGIDSCYTTPSFETDHQDELWMWPYTDFDG